MRESTHDPKPPTMATGVVLSPANYEPFVYGQRAHLGTRGCGSENMERPLTAFLGLWLSLWRRLLSSCA